MDRQEIVENLRKYRTLKELYQSSFFTEFCRQIESILATPQIYSFPGAIPSLNMFLRVAQWNIEKGKAFNTILNHLQTDEILKWADVIILNEADCGMNRSQNRHVAFDIAKSLRMNAAFGPAYIELTKGTGAELLLEGENCESLQGNAVLSRYPVLDSQIVPLPNSFEPYEFEEKRYGRRNCLWAQLQIRGKKIWIGSTHIELRNTPRCRAKQIRYIMKRLPGKDKDDDIYILGGDFNVNGFRRGTGWRAFQSALRVLFCETDSLKERLLHPEWGSEPLFGVLNRNGFDWEKLNSNEETARAEIDSLDETAFLPSFLAPLIQKRLAPYNGYLCFKLDWLLGRRVQALAGNQKCDAKTGIASHSPARIKGINSGPVRMSDHLPIYADFDLP